MRPNLHFTPPKGWMNDPNGLVYYNNRYHLFYQHNPYSCEWDSMHWGHAVSDDLIRWEHLPIALVPDEDGDIFSGSCIVDKNNVSGFGTEESPALLAFYTSHHPSTLREEQCLAISNDGVHFTKYELNPIIPGTAHTPARDPFVFENDILGGYTMCFTTEDSIRFYHSEDLLNWEETGIFTLPQNVFQGMIECPAIFRCDNHYVLMMSMDIPETEYKKFPVDVVQHNRLMQYLIGEFDGNTFVITEEPTHPLLVDEGCEFYAGTIFNNVDDTILMAWLGNSEKCMSIPTEKEGFRGVLSFPRKLSVVDTKEGYRLKHEFYPDLSNDTSDGKEISDVFVLEKISADGLKASTNVIDI
ncbi:MAG: glycoside hydrolase family 32 protein [Eubacterium sp.]|nr:glycoside hydrolase family 32 protein [Eubacterium sp.]